MMQFSGVKPPLHRLAGAASAAWRSTFSGGSGEMRDPTTRALEVNAWTLARGGASSGSLVTRLETKLTHEVLAMHRRNFLTGLAGLAATAATAGVAEAFPSWIYLGSRRVNPLIDHDTIH